MPFRLLDVSNLKSVRAATPPVLFVPATAVQFLLRYHRPGESQGKDGFQDVYLRQEQCRSPWVDLPK